MFGKLIARARWTARSSCAVACASCRAPVANGDGAVLVEARGRSRACRRHLLLGCLALAPPHVVRVRLPDSLVARRCCRPSPL